MTKQKMTPWIAVQLYWIEFKCLYKDLARGTKPLEAWLAGVYFGIGSLFILQKYL